METRAHEDEAFFREAINHTAATTGFDLRLIEMSSPSGSDVGKISRGALEAGTRYPGLL